MRFSSQRNAQHHVIMISDLLVTVNGLWMWLFAALAIRFLNILFCCRDGLKVKDQRPKQRGNNSPVWAKGGATKTGSCKVEPAKGEPTNWIQKKRTIFKVFFIFFICFLEYIFCLGFQHYHPYAVLRCDALEKEVTLSCTRYWPKMAPFFSVGGTPVTPVTHQQF